MILSNKNVLITGGTGQLGQVVAQTFATAGARVAVTYIFEQELSYIPETLKKQILVVRTDVTNEQEVTALFHQVGKQFSVIDILINLVGGFIPKTPLEETRTKDWDHMMNINLKSTFYCCREFLKLIKGKPYGRIISMAAMPALNPTAGRAAYAVSKAGVVILTRVLGEELKWSGITANAIAPSIIKTKANMESMPNEDFSKWVEPSEIADTMLYLCSDNAKSINGLTIPMFGGI
jgi:NAD(P)-dependent dehydrogenase (short-subunit alcohol dehydrogenase family)